MKFMLD